MRDYYLDVYTLQKNLGIEESNEIELSSLGQFLDERQTPEFSNFASVLNIHLDKVRGDYKTDKLILCFLILCCKSYSFNHRNVPMYTDNEIHALWRAMSTCQECLIRQVSYVPHSLFHGRNATSFETWFLRNRSSYIDTRGSNKNHAELSKRNDRLKSTNELRVVGSIGHLVTSREYSCHTSYADLVLWLCNYTDGQIGHWNSRPLCGCTDTIQCENVESDEKCTVCSVHGASGTCRYVIYKARDTLILLKATQCVYIARHLDRYFPMPHQIRSEIQKMFEFLGYKPIVNIRLQHHNVKIMSTDPHSKGVKVEEARQCICLGCIDTSDGSVVSWMIRPTINYAHAVFSCNADVLNSVIAEMRRYASRASHAPLMKSQLEFKETRMPDGTTLVKVTGPLCTYVADSPIGKRVGLRLSSLAMGASTLNITVVRSTHDGHHIMPVLMNIRLIYAITSCTSKISENIVCTRERNKVVVRFLRNVNGHMTGPSLTLGVNGGVQWIGNPNSLASSFTDFIRCVSESMKESEFINVVELSNIGTMTEYPAGVTRRESGHC